MKKTFLLIAFASSSFTLNAQDILVKKGGEVENVKVLEVSPTEVKFKKSNNPDGPVFIENRSNLYSIKYQNGEVQLFEEKEKSKNTVSLPPSIYANPPKFTHEAELFIGDGWGLGYQLRKDFNQYVGWDIIGVSYMTHFESPGNIGLVNIRPLGVNQGLRRKPRRGSRQSKACGYKRRRHPHCSCECSRNYRGNLQVYSFLIPPYISVVASCIMNWTSEMPSIFESIVRISAAGFVARRRIW